jgi:fatty-acyl-CoA synthase
MMQVPLNTWLLFEGAATHHGRAEIVTRLPDGDVHRYTYAEFARRTHRLMNVLDRLGLAADAVVATLAWNSFRHFEAYFAVPCSGRVLHTLNIRLSAGELAFVMQDAQDSAVLVDPAFIPLVAQVATASQVFDTSWS